MNNREKISTILTAKHAYKNILLEESTRRCLRSVAFFALSIIWGVTTTAFWGWFQPQWGWNMFPESTGEWITDAITVALSTLACINLLIIVGVERSIKLIDKVAADQIRELASPNDYDSVK